MTQTPGQWAGRPQPTGQPTYGVPQPYPTPRVPQPYQSAPGVHGTVPEAPPRSAPQGGLAAPQPYPAAAQQYSQPSGYPQGAYGGTPPTGGLECRVCGAGPAVKATFVGITGFAVAWTVRRWRGPYCRTCGLATFREAVSETLVGGWWLIVGFVVVPGYVLANLFGRSRVSGLGEPSGQRSQPAVPGPPVLARPKVQIVAVLGILLWVLFFVFAKWKP